MVEVWFTERFFMHIPDGMTHDMDILSFREALVLSDQPSTSFDRSRWLYVPPFYTGYRYVLGTRGDNPLICIGINPSTAAPDQLDNTLKSVERIATGNAYDSFIMFNVYAQRATRPDDMEPMLNERMHRENMSAFAHMLSLTRNGRPAVWAAWGTIIEKRSYLLHCVRDMVHIGASHDAQWYTAGAKSRRGHPHHPLYLRADSVLEPFLVGAYLDGLNG
jgi:hypothetical protein